MKPGTSASFAPVKQVEAGRLNVGCAEAGPPDAPAVILLHGWPYDIHSFADVTPLLAAAGYRVIVPCVCGYGTTRFLSDDAPRNGQQAALAVDVVALMDALGIDQAILAGFDWGARSAGVVAALWPDRCTALVSVSGYLIGSQAAGAAPLPPQAEHAWWYQYYFATGRPGRARDLPARVQQAHLAARLTEMGLRRRHVRAHRGRLRQPRSRRDRDPQLPVAARPGRRRAALRRPGGPARRPAIAVPAITLEGDANGAPHPGPSAYASKFTGNYAHRTIEGGIGHNLPQEAPQAFAQAIADIDGF